MGDWLAAALPVLPGQTERAAGFARECEARMQEFERFNERAGLTRYEHHLVRTPQGDIVVVVMEADDLSQLGRQFTDSEYDQWWLGYLRDVHGIDDPAKAPIPEPVFVWKKS